MVISYSRQLPDLTGKIRGIFCTLACDPNSFPATKQPSSQTRREKSLPEPNLLAKTFQRGLPSRVPGKQVLPRAGQGNLTYSGLLLESPICNFPFGNLLQPAVARPTDKIRGIFCTLACDPNTFPVTKQQSSQARREKSLPEPNLLAKTFQRGLPSRVPGKQVPPRAGQGNLTYSGLLLERPISNCRFGNLLQPIVSYST